MMLKKRSHVLRHISNRNVQDLYLYAFQVSENLKQGSLTQVEIKSKNPNTPPKPSQEGFACEAKPLSALSCVLQNFNDPSR